MIGFVLEQYGAYRVAAIALSSQFARGRPSGKGLTADMSSEPDPSKHTAVKNPDLLHHSESKRNISCILSIPVSLPSLDVITLY